MTAERTLDTTTERTADLAVSTTVSAKVSKPPGNHVAANSGVQWPAAHWSVSEWIQHTNAALKSYHSVLALARSPLAESELVRPLLVLDDISPTATERGQALRLVLRWAVSQLAPERPVYALGTRRPMDDPTWQDPLWWRYNILRHRYIEPLHPDEFVEGGRITDTLVGRMGIPSQDTYFDERNRAVRETAQWLQQELTAGQAEAQLRDLALEAAYAPVARERAAALLLTIAATFGQPLESALEAGRDEIMGSDTAQGKTAQGESALPDAGTSDAATSDAGTSGPAQAAHQTAYQAANEGAADAVFPQELLLELADRENLHQIEASLAWLVRRRYLQAGDDDRYLQAGDADRHLWMSPVLQAFLYARQSPDQRRARHRRTARYFEARDQSLRAARHLLHAQQVDRAASLVLEARVEPDDEPALAELAHLLANFPRADLPGPIWGELQIRLADLLAARGERNAALAACRRGLQMDSAPDSVHSPTQAGDGETGQAQAQIQGRIYRRMGKLYEKQNQLHALGYYDQAAQLLPPEHPEMVTLLKDRGWLHILRQAWALAEADLRRALALVPAGQRALQADIDDALASLFRHQKQFDAAIDFARRALRAREALGDLLRVAHSFNNLGLIYNELGDFRHAIAAFEEAIAIFARLNNRDLIAGARLNIGLAHHLDGDLDAAVEAYTASLLLCQAIDLPLVAARAHANLVEVYAAQDNTEAARQHWQTGLALSVQAGFDDEIAYYRELQEQFPDLRAAQAEAERAGAEFPAPASKSAAQSVPQPTAATYPPQWAGLDPDRRALLELAHHNARITPRQVMAALDVSKATATRRLAVLVDEGLLARHGEGRGVYYTPVDIPVDPAPDAVARAGGLRLGEWTAYVAAHDAALAQQYGVCALGVDAQRPTRWYVDFTRPPDLDTFFALERQLCRWLELSIDLKPLSQAASASHEVAPQGITPQGITPHEVVWVWQAATDGG